MGDIVKVVNGQYLPADVVLLSSRSGGLVGTALKSVLRTVECPLAPGEDSGHLLSISGSPPPPTLLLSPKIQVSLSSPSRPVRLAFLQIPEGSGESVSVG